MEGVNKVRGPDGVVESGIASKVLDDEAKWACGLFKPRNELVVEVAEGSKGM